MPYPTKYGYNFNGWSIGHKQLVDGYYEFILRYPRLSATAYNRWKQTGSPWESAPGGYERIETSWTAHAGPLRKASGDAQFNCDNVGSTTWYAAIGQTNGWTNGSIPGADGNQQFETELWIRIDDGKGHLFYDGTMADWCQIKFLNHFLSIIIKASEKHPILSLETRKQW